MHKKRVHIVRYRIFSVSLLSQPIDTGCCWGVTCWQYKLWPIFSTIFQSPEHFSSKILAIYYKMCKFFFKKPSQWTTKWLLLLSYLWTHTNIQALISFLMHWRIWFCLWSVFTIRKLALVGQHVQYTPLKKCIQAVEDWLFRQHGSVFRQCMN